MVRARHFRDSDGSVPGYIDYTTYAGGDSAN
jgi:hypothetical protein